MLKLEKKSLFSPLSYRLKEREKWIEPQLFKAFGIAFALHAGFFLLFQIHPFFPSSFFLFPPVEVQSDLSLQEVNAFDLIEVPEEEDALFPSLSLVPSLAWEPALQTDRAFNFDVFQNLEHRMWPTEFPPLSVPLEENTIELRVSEELAEYLLVQADPRLEQRHPLSFLAPFFVSYQVEIDERSGEVFWYQRLLSSGQEKIDALTEDILLNLKFSTEINKKIGGRVYFKLSSSIELF